MNEQDSWVMDVLNCFLDDSQSFNLEAMAVKQQHVYFLSSLFMSDMLPP